MIYRKYLKSKFLFLLMALSTGLLAKADTHYIPHISIGGRAGMTLSEMSFSPSVKQSFTNGFMFGAAFTYAEERHVGLRAELNLTQRGWKENFEELNDEFNYKRTLTYIELPIMTHIFFGGRKVKCLFNLGPEFCYMISESVSSNFDYKNPGSVPGFPNINRHTEQMYLDVKNKFDYGICAGVGMEYLLNRKNSLQLEVRYYYGLGNIYPAAKKDIFGASRNMTISVTLGYMFRVK